MYGTIAKMRLKAGIDLEEVREIGRLFAARNVPGFIAEYFYQTDADPQTVYIAVIFDSEASYQANTVTPAQHEEYLRLRALLEADPEWHDGKIIFPVKEG
jgi:heme-degrading monooxygenase HmoA